jgi:glycerol-3-phosphate acyltransferase PlsY
MNTTLIYVLSVLVAYLTGSIPFGFLIGKMRGVDVRTVGSKNIGATNVYRTVGHKWGFLAFFCDFLKGLLPTLGAKAIAGGSSDAALAYLPLVVGVMTVAGHMWTCFMKFKGGKGIATGFGMLVALVPWLVLTAFGIFVVTVWISHYISLGSILAAAFLLVAVWFPILGTPGWHNLPQCILVAFVAAFAIWKHKSNIQRLEKGCENKLY